MSKQRVIPMQCGDDESYVLLFYEGDGKVKLDVYDAKDHEKIQTLNTPFPVGGIETIRYIQSFDVMFFAQPDTAPCKLTRKDKAGGAEGEYVFSFENNEFLPEPVLEWNDASKHTIKVFAISETPSSGSVGDYYPRGTRRPASEAGVVTVRAIERLRGAENAEGNAPWRYSIEATAETSLVDNPGLTEGELWLLYGDIKFKVCHSYDNGITFSGADGKVEDLVNRTGYYPYDYETEVRASCGEVVSVEKKSSTHCVVTLRLGKVSATGIVPLTIRIGGNVKDRTATAKLDVDTSGNPGFYIATKNAPTYVDVTNTEYYKFSSGSGFYVGMKIDGSNTNENMHIGQIIALKYKSRIFASELWDYETYPAAKWVTDEAYGKNPPEFSKSDGLQSPNPSKKKDSWGRYLYPAQGGGYGKLSKAYPVRGTVNLKTEGKWSGVLELWEIDNKGNRTTIATIAAENALSNTDLSRDIDEFGSTVRVACVRREKAYEVTNSIKGDGDAVERTWCVDNGCQWTLTSEELQVAYLRVIEKKSNYYVCEAIGGVFEDFETNSYALGAWCKETGYPSLITIYQERLVYARNKSKPMTLWMSKTNKWTDFELGTLDTSAITATLATDRYDMIQWLFPSKNGIIVGSQYSEFSVGSNDGAVTTSDNLLATVTSNIGSDGVGADTVKTATIMVKTGGKELYRIDYNTISEEAAGNQVNLFSSHLFEDDPVVRMFSIKAPSNTLFCLHESGKLSSLTYEPDYGVTGWARHHVLDGVVDGCVFRRRGKDVLCLLVRDGDKTLIGELDLSADVWKDDGRAYESAVTAVLMLGRTNGTYGKQQNIAGCDVYVGEGTLRFDARLNGGDWVRVDNGFDANNAPIPFPRQRVELPATSAWVDEPIVELRGDSPYPLIIHGIGASVVD